MNNWKISSDFSQIPTTPESITTTNGRGASWMKNAALAAVMLALTPAMQSCEPDTKVEPIVVDKYAGMSQEQKMEAWHQEAEAYATAQGWSQGVRSLVAGVIDYHYYKESANGPLLIRLSYQVDVNDFIGKIEADAAKRGTYDPKTEGFFQGTVSSLEGDGKQNFWNIPSSVLYDAFDQ
jgi:hypothetical protein